MKIIGIFFGNEIRTGGHKRYLELMEGLSLKGHEVTVYLNSFFDWNPCSFKAIRIPAFYIKGKNKFLGRLFSNCLRKEISGVKVLKADWIIIFGETHWLSAKMVSGKYNIPVLFAYRSDSVQESLAYLKYEKPGLIKKLKLYSGIIFETIREKDITRNASCIAFQSESDRDNYLSRNPEAEKKTTVIRGDIQQPRFKIEFANKNNSIQCRKLLFVGTLGRRKGLEYLIRALPLLSEEMKKTIHLDILAAGSDYSLYEKIIFEYGLQTIVSFHGKVDFPLSFMAESDLLVVPSLFDSFPNVVLEALHTGLPVIGSRAGGIPDMLSDGKLIFETASSKSIADLLSLIIHDDKKYTEIRNICAGRRAVFDFDWAAEWEKTLNNTTIVNKY